MPAFEIVKVQTLVRDWESSKGGPMKSYRIDLKDEAGDVKPSVEWARKATSPAPEVGQRIEGDVTEGDYGAKFKQAASGFGGGGRGRDPVEEAKTRRSIQMQHAQKCAVDALKLAAEYGTGENKYQPPSAADVVAQVKVIASGLFQQIDEVSK